MNNKSEAKKDILEILNKTTFDENGYPHIPSETFSERVVKKIGKTLKKDFLNFNTVHSIILEVLPDELNAHEEDNKSELTSALKNKEDEIANIIVKRIDELPYEYEYIFNLGNKSVQVPSTKLSKNVWISTLDSSTSKKYLRLESLFRSIQRQSTLYKEGDLIVTVRASGHVSRYGISSSLITTDPVYLFKSTVMALYVLDVFSLPQYKIKRFYKFSRDYDYKILRKGEEVSTETTSSDNSKFIQSIYVSEEIQKQSDIGTTFNNAGLILKRLFDSSREYKIKSKGEKPGKVKELKRYKSRLKSLSSRIQNALYWFYESQMTSAPYGEVVNLVAAYDSLFGEEEKDEKMKSGITKAEIVAYTIASNATEIQSIKERVMGLYDLRNKIIHGLTPIHEIFKEKPIDEEHPLFLIFMNAIYFTRFIKRQINAFNKSFS